VFVLVFVLDAGHAAKRGRLRLAVKQTCAFDP